jgi:hypothetical protein
MSTATVEPASVRDITERLNKLWSEYTTAEFNILMIAKNIGKELNEAKKALGAKCAEWRKVFSGLATKPRCSPSKLYDWMKIATYWQDIQNEPGYNEDSTIRFAREVATRRYQEDHPDDNRRNSGSRGNGQPKAGEGQNQAQDGQGEGQAPATHSVPAVRTDGLNRLGFPPGPGPGGVYSWH